MMIKVPAGQVCKFCDGKQESNLILLAEKTGNSICDTCVAISVDAIYEQTGKFYLSPGMRQVIDDLIAVPKPPKLPMVSKGKIQWH